jgi:hypothetical protein
MGGAEGEKLGSIPSQPRPARLHHAEVSSVFAHGGQHVKSVAELPPWPSSPWEFHPEALTEPCLTVSGHMARAIHGELPPPCHERSVPPVTG